MQALRVHYHALKLFLAGEINVVRSWSPTRSTFLLVPGASDDDMLDTQRRDFERDLILRLAYNLDACLVLRWLLKL